MNRQKVATWLNNNATTNPDEIEETGPSSSSSRSHRTTTAAMAIFNTSLNNLELVKDEYDRLQKEMEVEVEDFHSKKRGYDAILQRGDFVSSKDKIPSMADTIRSDQFYGALIGYVATPGEFYVNPAKTWTALENMMTKLQHDYRCMEQVNDQEDTTIGVPWKPHLVKGFILGVKYDGEYHRAKIMTPLAEDKYMVQLLDYGDVFVADFDHLRYLPRTFLAWKTQAIRCKVMFKNLSAGQPWTEKDGDVLRGMMKRVNCFLIHFKKEFKIDGETAWEVFIHVYDSRREKITKFHMERDMIIQTGRTLGLQDEEDTDTDPGVALAEFKYAEGYLAKPNTDK